MQSKSASVPYLTFIVNQAPYSPFVCITAGVPEGFESPTVIATSGDTTSTGQGTSAGGSGPAKS